MLTVQARVAVILALCTLVACDAGPSGPQLSDEAASYLNAALDTMQTHHVYRQTRDWSAFRQRVMERADGAQVPQDTYSAIRYAVDALDNHSSFSPASNTSTQRADFPTTEVKPFSSKNTRQPPIQGVRLTDRIGYVKVPSFSGGLQESIEFADELQGTVERVDSTTVCGWVVDLRSNHGGNMWPMVTGIGPVVGEGHLGSFVTPEADTLKWHYENGASVYEGDIITAVSGTPYQLHRPFPPVAVLMGEQTASSGEAVLVAFQGRDRTKTFGHPTGGYTTAIRKFPLRDGAALYLAVAEFADRTGQVYKGKIYPDLRPNTAPSEIPTYEDPIVDTAQGWVENRPEC